MSAPRTLADVDWESWRPVDPATLVFVVESDRILLIRKKRGLGAGKINGPGGKLDPGETPLECAVRETREEIGIEPVEPVKVGEHRFQFVDGYAIHVHVFVACTYRGKPVETAEATPLWAALDAIPYDEMWEDDRIWLPLLIEGTPFSGRYLFDDDRMLGYELDVGEDAVFS